MTKKTIGFYGDSFCARKPIDDDIIVGEEPGNVSWVKQLEQEYKLIHVGQSGSNIWDCILYQWGEHQVKFDKAVNIVIGNHNYLQYATLNPDSNIFNRYKKDNVSGEVYPDIAVFCWTKPARIFTEERLGICPADIIGTTIRRFEYDKSMMSDSAQKSTRKIIAAAQQYYGYLFSKEQTLFQYEAALHFFDTHFLNKIPKKTKILHFYVEDFKRSAIGILDMHYAFKNGMTIYPCLELIREQGQTKTKKGYVTDPHECHMDTIEKNNFLCSMVRQSLESYSNGETRDFEIPMFVKKHFTNLSKRSW